MATTVEECLAIAKASAETGKKYMMMETAVYGREFLYAKELVESGRLGKIQFMRGSHQQNMGLPGWPDYWYGFPPMHYATHAVSPLLALANTPIAVTLLSDMETEVILYKVARLGRFQEHRLELRPGKYTAVGQRLGYRDVRQEFTVSHESGVAPVTVACTEPI